MSIRENFAMPTLRQDARLGWWSPSSSRHRFYEHAFRAKIVFGGADDRITTLSGGNQQKVVVARWLAAHPRVLVLNDPTRGIDIGAKRDLYRLLGELATEGLAVVMLSTELDEHVELMDRVLVFREHELQAEIAHDTLSRQTLVSAFFDRGSAPAAAAAESAPARSAEAVSVPAMLSAPSSGLPGEHQSAAQRFAPAQVFALLLRKYSFGVALVLALGLLIANLLTQEGGFGWEAQLANLAPLALAAMASTPSIISGGGGFDLSISPLMILTSAVFVVWLVPHGLGGAEAVPILLALGAGVGLINGLLVIVLRVQPVVVTLSMYFVLIGVILAVVSTTASISSSWVTNLAGEVGPVPGAVFTIGAPLLIWFVLTHASYGRLLYAVGSNDATAFASGVNVAAVRVIAYGLGGLIAAIGGLAVVALEHSASSGLATTYTLLAIAGVALGGTSLWGGRGGLFGSFLGAATIYLLGNVLQTLQINPQWLQVMYGLVLLFAVVLGGLAARTRIAL
jgi:ribose transport system permease protein